MKHALPESSMDGSVAAAQRAYQNFLTSHSLADFSQHELDSAESALRLQGCARIDTTDIHFQAAITRLRSRRELSSQTVEDILKQLMYSEYDLDQAQWERDCHHKACASHSSMGMPAAHVPTTH